MNSIEPISRVVIYSGHQKHELFGSYHENIVKQIGMFTHLNNHRIYPWKVISTSGEQLIETLKEGNSKETLLVIPAGQSSRLEKVFSIAEIAFIKDEFFAKGGRGYLTCGAAYWASSKRIYKELCEENSDKKETIVKHSTLALFDGIAEGPLCPFPGQKYKVGFYSDAVKVSHDLDDCTIFLSGGGSFLPQLNSEQKVRVLVRYPHSELIRLGKKPEECQKWENGALLVSVGKGAILLAMFHPYYGSQDINADAYERAFPDCGTDWKKVQERLSPLDKRMQFFMKHMLAPLENLEFQ